VQKKFPFVCSSRTGKLCRKEKAKKALSGVQRWKLCQQNTSKMFQFLLSPVFEFSLPVFVHAKEALARVVSFFCL
jgi:hypothetical protein